MARYRSTLGDRFGIALQKQMDYQIHFVSEMQGRVDLGRMSRAVLLSFEAEPVLGSRIVPHWFRPYWQKIDNIPESEYFSTLEVSPDEVSKAVSDFIAEPFDSDVGPQIKVKVVRSDNDTLALKVHHIPSDGASVKEYAYLLASIYKALGDNPDYVPRPTTGIRGIKVISDRKSFGEKCSIIMSGLRQNARKKAAFMLPEELGNKPSSASVPSLHRETISPERFMAIKTYGKERGATIHDMLMASCYHALKAKAGKMPGVPMGIMTTVDLRGHHIPADHKTSICNMSAFFYSSQESIGPTYDDTLSKIHAEITAIKADNIGLGDYPNGYVAFKLLPFFIGRAIFDLLVDWSLGNVKGGLKAGFTNLGIIDEGLLDFGDIGVEDAYAYAPMSTDTARVIIIGASTYKNKISISSGVHGDSNDSRFLRELIKAIVAELPV